ncbi:hypothetical protein [Streptomyces albicerus]|uniref:hypothetical protein n=1 Tax=Streptomyces albicerus TaxID=2569859 RepID=UPI00124AFAF5|nr:hypothetical protein [Streptomyces albicerus]
MKPHPSSKPELPCPSGEFAEDRRDQAVATPESELAPLLAAWDLAHPAAADDPEWRHLLDELAHPRTTEAFYRLAVAAGS